VHPFVFCSHGNSVGLFVDTANTRAGSAADLNVTGITPGGAPRVLDEEVRSTVLSAIADSEDSVIEGGTAGGSSDNTRGVELEDHLVGLNSNRDGLFVKSSSELVGVVGGDSSIAGNVGDTLG